jgi:hypothetical protein
MGNRFVSCGFRVGLICATVALGSLRGTAGAQLDATTPPSCSPDGPLVKVADLPEASGLAMSRRVPGRLWAHNDSGEPILYALDTKGVVTGRLQLIGAEVEDWEAVAVGPCPAGACIHVADIGDNDAERTRVTVYRVIEPSGAAGSALPSERFHATYPDGPHDAESLLISPDGRLHVVTKGDTGPVAIYRFPAELRPGATVQLERVGHPRDSRQQAADRITDGAVSPDGAWVALRTNHALLLYDAGEWLAGSWPEPRRVDLKSLGEPQGEGVAFGADGTIYVAGEGGGKSRPGTFGRLRCTTAAPVDAHYRSTPRLDCACGPVAHLPGRWPGASPRPGSPPAGPAIGAKGSTPRAG